MSQGTDSDFRVLQVITRTCVCEDRRVAAIASAVLSIALAGLIAVAGYADPWIVVAAGGVCVLALAIGWPHMLMLPHRSGTTFLIVVLGGGALVVGLRTAPTATDPARPLSAFAAVVAVALLLAFLHELLRRDGRANVVESVTGTLTGQVIAILAAGWVLLVQIPEGPQGIVLGAAALMASRVVLALPVPGVISILVAIAAGGATGFAVAMALVTATPVKGLIAGACVAGVGAALDRLLDPDTGAGHDQDDETEPAPGAQGRLAVFAHAAAPVAAAGTVAYALLQFSPG